MASQTGSDKPHPLDDMVDFLKVQLKAQEERRRIEFALQQIAHAMANPYPDNGYQILVNGSWKFTKQDGRVAMRILTSFLRGSTFELTEDSVDDIFGWKNSLTSELNIFLQLDNCVPKQMELLFHLLGKVPQVTETKGLFPYPYDTSNETTELVISAIFSYD